MKRWILALTVLLLAAAASGAPRMDHGRKLLSHYGWVCGPEAVEMSLPLPDSFEDGPEAAYQRASKAIGYDLSAAKGQEITLIRYTLTRRSEVTKSRLYGHVAFYKTGIIGAWLSTDGPIAPGIIPLDDDSFGKGF